MTLHFAEQLHVHLKSSLYQGRLKLYLSLKALPRISKVFSDTDCRQACSESASVCNQRSTAHGSMVDIIEALFDCAWFSFEEKKGCCEAQKALELPKMLSTTANTSQEEGLAVLSFKAVFEAKETAIQPPKTTVVAAFAFCSDAKESQRLALPCCVLRLCTAHHMVASCESSAGSQLCCVYDML